jgi:hypothetical protein
MYFDSKIVDNLQVVVGMSLTKWKMTEYELVTGETVNGVTKYSESAIKYSIKGAKFGGRIGIEYKISDNLAFNAIFQLVELGTDWSHLPSDEPDEEGRNFTVGLKAWNPSWLQFGLKFSF